MYVLLLMNGTTTPRKLFISILSVLSPYYPYAFVLDAQFTAIGSELITRIRQIRYRLLKEMRTSRRDISENN